jgi:stage V sporulation protein AF
MGDEQYMAAQDVPGVEYCPISNQLDTNVTYINQLVGIGTSWDIVAKPFEFGHVKMMSYVTNGFFMTMNMVLIIEDVQRCVVQFEKEKSGAAYTVEELANYLSNHVAFVQVQTLDKMEDAVRFILSGPMVTFMEGFDKAFVIDTRIYPMRSIGPPMTENVIRGSHDGFTETMLMNTSMIRRRLRDPRLRVELMQVGTRSQTDVSLLYLDDVADSALVEDMKSRLKNVKTDALTMGEQQLMDLIGKIKWNPYPIARYTERPDVASTALLEGQVVIVVDTSCEAIIAPTTLFNHLQNPQEYHSYPLVGTYVRWVILTAVFLSIFLPGVFLVINAHPHWIPKTLTFFIASKTDPLPLWAEILTAEFAIDMLRLAVLNTPNSLASSVSIVAALLFGSFAAKIQLLQPEVLVYTGVVMIAQYATSSYELGSANQMTRLWMILWTALLGGIGFLIALLSWFILLLTTKSFGKPYLWPLLPFKWKNGLRDVIFRIPFGDMDGVPDIFKKRNKA